MNYKMPDRAWVEKELKIMDGMGRDWFLKNPPKVWRVPKIPDDLILETIRRKLMNELGLQFKCHAPFAHRYIRDLVSEKQKIVIHHWSGSECERKLQKILGYKFYLFYKKNWREGIDKIIKELKSEGESLVQ